MDVPWQGQPAPAPLVEVRLLGPFRVRSHDGALVDARAWRTAKTRDLVRLLAVADRVVPVDRIVDALWPDVEPQRGRASLRTAASQVRQVLGGAHLVRQQTGYELRGAWVDAAAFAATAATAGHLFRQDQPAAGLTAAWEALALCSGDLCEEDPYAEWLADERANHRRRLRQLLLDSAAAAIGLGRLRDAVELGHRALAVDPCAESAFRTLMRAYSALGETEQALRTFEQCRHALADGLGADPSEQTRALHLELLRTGAPTRTPPPLVGRERWLQCLGPATSAVLEEGRSRGVLVTGPAGIGRSRFLHEAVQRWPERRVVVACPPTAAAADGGLVRDLARALGASGTTAEPTVEDLRRLIGACPVLVAVDDAERADAASVRTLVELLEGDSAPVLLLVSARAGAATDSVRPLAAACAVVALPELVVEEVAELLVPLLKGTPSRALVDELVAGSAGVPGRLVQDAQELVSAGQLLSTPDGMVHVAGTVSRSGVETESRLAVAREQGGPAAAAALDRLAVLDRPTALRELARLVGVRPNDLRPALDQLCDRRLVVQVDDGFRLVDAQVREAAYRWLRPTVRRDLHLDVAERAYLPTAARVEHWLRSGEPVLACAAALQAAEEALAAGDDASARAHLRRVRSFAAENDVGVEERIALAERLADVTDRLGRRWEARELVEEAIALAGTGAPHALPRLYRELGRRAETTSGAVNAYTAASVLPSLTAQDLRSTAVLLAGVLGAGEPDLALTALPATIADADAAQDAEAQVAARVLLVRAAGQRRRPDLAQRTAKEAMRIAEACGSDLLFVRAAHALVRTGAFLGDGLRHEDLLRRVRERSLRTGDAALVDDVLLTCCLVAHDTGDPAFASLWQRACSGPDGNGLLRQLLDLYFSVERGQLARAARLLSGLPVELRTPAADDAVWVLRARLLVATGDESGAVRALTSVLAERPTGESVLAAEAAARLAALLAGTDLAAARGWVESASTMTGSHVFPREQVCLQLARAAVLAAEGEPASAATMAMAAGMTARGAGLVFAEADAWDACGRLLSAAGRDRDAEAAASRATGLRAAAGAMLPRPRTGAGGATDRRPVSPPARRPGPTAEPAGLPVQLHLTRSATGQLRTHVLATDPPRDFGTVPLCELPLLLEALLADEGTSEAGRPALR